MGRYTNSTNVRITAASFEALKEISNLDCRAYAREIEWLIFERFQTLKQQGVTNGNENENPVHRTSPQGG